LRVRLPGAQCFRERFFTRRRKQILLPSGMWGGASGYKDDCFEGKAGESQRGLCAGDDGGGVSSAGTTEVGRVKFEGARMSDE